MTACIIEWSAKHRFFVIFSTIFLIGIAIWCVKHVALDALPDLSDTQVIIYSRIERSPDIIEDQVTYPIIAGILGAPRVKAVRGLSDFGYSFVYVIFEDGTDLYWARSRVLEYLAQIQPRLPEGVTTEIGPDASGLGWVYQYALVNDGTQESYDVRALQDWNLKLHLQTSGGVSEVASLGGPVKQYQVNLDPESLLSYNISLSSITEAIRKSNRETGGRVVEMSGHEYMVRGRGYIKGLSDIENIVVRVDDGGTPVLLRNLGRVQLGPDIRRGVSDLDGMGEVTSGIVVMRTGENALAVIQKVKNRIAELAPSFPEGVKLVAVYDRSELIERAISTLKSTLVEEIIVVSLIVLLFLWHLPSATTTIITIPVSILLSFIPLYLTGQTSNIMSLAGIAISIGVLVDGAIVQVENMYHRIQIWMNSDRSESFESVRLRALTEVGSSVFFSLLVIAVAFLPVFTLLDQEGRLFKPLAYSKNFAMGIAALLSLTLDPAIRMLYSRYEFFNFKPVWLSNALSQLLVGRYFSEESHPISRILFRLYEPACLFVLRYRKQTLAAAVLLVLSTIPVYMKLGSEFMPHLNEGAILYMPVSLPGISITEAKRSLQLQDQILKSFPEVERVFGKVGRADTATDPAPLSMVETVVMLRPESEWREVGRWYSFLPELFKPPLRRVWRDRITYDDLISEMDRKLRIPGWTNAWTMPIKNRIDMLSTGIRTPVGIKIAGNDLKEIERVGLEIEKIIHRVPGTRSVFAERVAGGYFLDFDLKREELARYGLTVEDALTVVESAIGGANLTSTVEGRKRFPVNVRYAREFRQSLPDLKRILIATPSGAQVPISYIANVSIKSGPSMIRDEDGLLSGYVYIDMAGRDIGSYVEDARKLVHDQLKLPPGTTIRFSGQYENMLRVQERLLIVVPLTIFLIVILLYWNTGSPVKTAIVILAVPFSLCGAVWLLYFLGYHISIAVWVGMIALMGLDAETGVFMLLFLDLSHKEWLATGKLRTKADLRDAILHGAVKRVRPKIMTVACGMIALIPILWSQGTGADVMKRIAAPMVGGLVTSFALELLIYPVLFYIWKEKEISE
ncbi:MAG: CusA/CzcA family heavy metal efflux RND transporter [Spirochaetia bacterium]|nr:CusA/CzcA family heavy metal efflux RND transporter [Spirochaetia bacterium]